MHASRARCCLFVLSRKGCLVWGLSDATAALQVTVCMLGPLCTLAATTERHHSPCAVPTVPTVVPGWAHGHTAHHSPCVTPPASCIAPIHTKRGPDLMCPPHTQPLVLSGRHPVQDLASPTQIPLPAQPPPSACTAPVTTALLSSPSPPCGVDSQPAPTHTCTLPTRHQSTLQQCQQPHTQPSCN